MPSSNPLLILVGPTAVGKTELALRLSERMGCEIVSADSRLFYRGMDIGTAKPSLEERSRVPHHLVDIARPDETVGLGRFQGLAREAIAGIQARNRLPLLVGGSGQYLRAVVQGWAPPQVGPNEPLRKILEALGKDRGTDWLYDRLARLDPPAASKIDARNLRRVIRAIEVILSSGRRFSDQRLRRDSPYRPLTVGLTRPRAELYARADARIEAMFACGFVEEVENLLAAGFSPSLPSFSAIGYGECARVIRGEWNVEQAKVEIRRKTRIFIRRQANWFKESDPQITWLDAGRADALERFAHEARKHLDNPDHN